MPDDDPRDRFSELGDLKDEYEGASKDGQDSIDEKDSNDGQSKQDGDDSMTDTTSVASQDSIDSKDDSDSTGASGQSVKASRESVQAYIIPGEKEELEDAHRQIKALCNLSGADEPLKNDFYAAALRYGYTDLEAICEYLDLAEAYAEYGEMVEE